MTEDNFQINYKLNGADMPVIEFSFPITESDSQFIFELLTVEKIHEANIESLGESNPADSLIVDQAIDLNADFAPTVHQRLDQMGATDVSYTYKGKTTHL